VVLDLAGVGLAGTLLPLRSANAANPGWIHGCRPLLSSPASPSSGQVRAVRQPAMLINSVRLDPRAQSPRNYACSPGPTAMQGTFSSLRRCSAEFRPWWRQTAVS